jgi:hypothetical protein
MILLLRQRRCGSVCAPVAGALLMCAYLLPQIAVAASAWSPAVRIAGLQVSDAAGDVLRIAVKWRICDSYLPPNGACQPPLGFNPADCSRLKSPVVLSGTNGSLDHFDFQLGLAGRRADKQDAILNQIYGAYATARMVRLSVRSDLCGPDGSRITNGIELIH